ncbi:MAG: Uma2 family endonuclease [Capsulimonadaceae bacterium]|nr:Uma2 family endonuclease [Capsulimonadaceae bacterium]
MAIDVVEISPITSRHSQILVFLACILKIAADQRDAGVVLAAPFIMKVSEDLILMPDMQFVSRDNIDRLHDDCIEGAPDIAIDIVAAGSDPTDRESNLADYDEAGVREYWLIDPEYKVASFYQRGTSKNLAPARVGESGIYRSKVLPDLWIKVGWLWDENPPKALVIVREWRLS